MTNKSARVKLLTLSFGLFGCSYTHYTPQLLARGELFVRTGGYRGVQLWAGGKRIAGETTGYAGLPVYVKCVPNALRHARKARQFGISAITLTSLASASLLAGVVHQAVTSSFAPNTLEPDQNLTVFYGLASIVLLLTRDFILWPHATGHAIDAHNFYNDAIGSLGGTCEDPTIPPPSPPPLVPPEPEPIPEVDSE